MDIQVNDILTMKKQHPCGSKQWQVLRIGMDEMPRLRARGHAAAQQGGEKHQNRRTGG